MKTRTITNATMAMATNVHETDVRVDGIVGLGPCAVDGIVGLGP